MLKQFTPGVSNGFVPLGPLLYRASTVSKWLLSHKCFVPSIQCLLYVLALLLLRAEGQGIFFWLP